MIVANGGPDPYPTGSNSGVAKAVDALDARVDRGDARNGADDHKRNDDSNTIDQGKLLSVEPQFSSSEKDISVVKSTSPNLAKHYFRTTGLSDKLLWKAEICRRLRSRAETHRPALVLAQTVHRLFLGLAFSPRRAAFRSALFLVLWRFLKLRLLGEARLRRILKSYATLATIMRRARTSLWTRMLPYRAP